jgi:ABC-2 type transport system permease protein
MTGNIINLVRRDFYVILSEKAIGFIFLFILIMSVVTVSRLNLWSMFFLFMLIFFYIQNVFLLEEKYRAEIFSASLPVRRSDLVMARYIGVAAIAGIYILVVYCANALMLYFKVSNIQPIPASYCVNILLTLVLTTSITYPFLFRFGFTKAQTTSRMLIVAVAMVAGGALGARTGVILIKSKGTGVVSALLSGDIYPQSIITTMVLFGASVILMGVTIPVTLVFYNKKDL